MKGVILGAISRKDLQQRAGVRFLVAETPAQHIVMRQQPLDLGRQGAEIGKIDGAQRPAAHLVFIGRADAALGGADFLAGRFFAHGVQLAMQRQHQHGIFRQDQHVRRDGEPRLADPRDFLQQRPGIHHHAIADDGALALHHAGRQQRQLVGLVAHHDGVAGIVAALEAHHHVGAVGQPVDDLAFAFVAPLGADHGHIGHGYTVPG